MKLFTVGPVEMYPETLRIEGTQQPYFRTPAFSAVMLDIEKRFLDTVNAPTGSTFVGLTCSGTGAMDAAVANVLTREDHVLVVNGGTFGARFAAICDAYQVPHEDFIVPEGEAFDKEAFLRFAQEKAFTALLVNACDTSTGQLYDLAFLGAFCKANGMWLIVDAVSAYLADEIDMQSHQIDLLLTASQKALALAPGVALAAMTEELYEQRIANRPRHLYYLDFADHVNNQRRGQPPFTSAVGTMLSLQQRLQAITEKGLAHEQALHRERAAYFRQLAKALPVTIPAYPLSNCCTPIWLPNGNAQQVFDTLYQQYGLVLTPSGGDLGKRQLRVGHLGNLTFNDYDTLISALKEVL